MIAGLNNPPRRQRFGFTGLAHHALLLSALLCAAPCASALTAQAITGFAPATPIAYTPGATFSLSATGGASGNPVLFASATAGICSVAGNTASVLAPGTCRLTASQAGSAGYSAAPRATASVIINKASQTITFGALPGQNFGSAPFKLSAAASSGLAVKFGSATPAACTVSGNTVKLAGAGSCAIVASQAGNAVYSAAAPVTQSFLVTPGNQAIAFGTLAERRFGSAPFRVSARASSGLAVAFGSATPTVCSVSGNTVTLGAAGTCSIAASQAGNAHYRTAAPVIQSFAVSQASQGISFAALPAQTFGAAPFALTAAASSGLPVAFSALTPAVCAVANAGVTMLSGGKCSIAANQAGNSDYKAATQVTRSLRIGKAGQTISFAALPGQNLSAAPLMLSATASSGLPVSYRSGSPAVCSVAGAMLTLLKAGNCSVTASQGGDASYSAAPQVGQSFTVSTGLAAQAITGFAPATPLAYRTGLRFVLSATGGASGMPIAFASATPGVCTVAGSTVSVTGTGTCTLTASQAGNAGYSAAPSVTARVAVTAGSQAIAFGALANQRTGADPFPVTALAASGLPVAFRSASPAVCTVAGSIVTVVAPGTCAITASQPGNVNFSAAPSVTQSFLVGRAAIMLAVGATHACALTHAGGVQCWGSNAYGQLGDGSSISRSTPVDVAGLPDGVAAVAAGGAHTCAITGSGAALCWGNNDAGQLGDGSTSRRSTPRAVSGLAGNVIALTLGASHTCALLGSGAVRCWGGNADGQLGDGSGLQRLTPVAVPGLSGVTDLRAGDYHTCAVGSAGAARCWGRNADGQLGDGSTISRASPVSVSGPGGGVAMVEGAARHSCALTGAGGVRCWGNNGSGQLGNGGTASSLVPVDVAGLGGIAAIAAGAASSCALDTAGGARCWGGGYAATPQEFGSGGIRAIGIGNGYDCVLDQHGAILCRGSNSAGQLGDGSTVSRMTPDYVSGLSGGSAANQSIAFDAPADKTVADAPFALTATASSGLAVSFVSMTPAVCTVAGSKVVTLVAPGVCTIAASQAGNGSVNAAQQVMQSFIVGPAIQSITGFAPGSPVAYSTGLRFLLSATGGASGMPVVFASATPGVCTVGGNMAAVLAAGSCVLTASQAAGAGYSAAPQVSATVVITVSTQTIGFAALPERRVSDAVFTVGASASSGLAVVFSSATPAVCTVAGNRVTLTATGTCSIAADQPGNAGIGAAPQVTQSFAVTQGTQAITDFAPPSPITYRAGLTFALTATGGASDSAVVFASVTAGVCSVAGSTVSVRGAGVCSLTANQAGDANYAAAPQVTASVLVEPLGQSIVFGELPDKAIGEAPFALAASASSGLAVTFGSGTGTVCTVAGNMVTLRAPGLCTITADQAGNGNTGAAPQVTQSFAVEAASQTIAFAALPDRTMGDAVMLSATASSGLAVGFASMTGAVCSVADVTVTLLAPGICTIAADQGGDGYYGAALQVTQSFAVGAGGVQVYYIHSDHLNTPRMITDANNTPVWEWKNTDPFGANLPDENPSTLGTFIYNPRFAGQYFDRETGLHQNWFRDFDPQTGRYLESDPIGLVAGPNTYSYVKGNPILYKDPKGLDIWLEGPNSEEIWGHQSVNVGDPNGSYRSYSYGMNGHGLEGEVYIDEFHGGEILARKRTTREQDDAFNKAMKKVVGMKSTYGVDDICRTWSQRHYNNAPGIPEPLPPLPDFNWGY